MKTFLLSFLLAFACIVSDAQARLFIVPAVQNFAMGHTIIRPKYDELCFRTSQINYSYQPLFLANYDCTPDAELFISQQPDVVAFPGNDSLDVTLSSLQVATLSATLEFLNIPANNIIDETYTWRKVARQITGMFLYMQRVKSLVGTSIVFDDKLPLNTTWADLDPGIKTGMDAAATSLGFDDSAIRASPNQTLRNCLKRFSDQWGNTPFTLNDLVL